MTRIDGATIHQWFLRAYEVFDDSREVLNALNVYPIPDADTGTNMYLTLAEGCANLGDESDSAADVTSRMAAGALLGARGNSGVIMSQYLRGLAIAWRGKDELSASDLASGLVAASRAAWRAVVRPVEGTVLTVARAAGEGATSALADAADVGPTVVATAAVTAARAALARTPDQLEILRRSGVVDAGAGGLVLFLGALVDVVTGKPHLNEEQDTGAVRLASMLLPRTSHPQGAVGAAQEILGEDEPADIGFEVMYVVRPGPEESIDDDAMAEVAAELDTFGTSVAVVGGAGTWQVHAHVGNVLRAIRAVPGAAQRQITVRALAHDDSSDGHVARTADGRGLRPGIGIVACTTVPGLAAELARSGAIVAVNRTSTPAGEASLVRAVAETGCTHVLVVGDDEVARRVRRLSGAYARRASAGLRGHDTPARVEPVIAPTAVHVWAAVSSVFDPTSADPATIDTIIETMAGAVAAVDVTTYHVPHDEPTPPVINIPAQTGLVTLVWDCGVPTSVRAAVRAEVDDQCAGAECVTFDSGNDGDDLLVGVER